MVMMLNIPIMLGMAVTARPLVIVLFGAQWVPCVPYLQILSLGGILWPLHVLNLNILLAQGYSNLFFRLEMIKKSVGILLMGTACFFGITAIAWSSVLIGVICFGINAHYSGRILGYGFLRQSIDLLPYCAVAMAMAVSIWAISSLSLGPPTLLLLSQVLVGAMMYVLLCCVLRLKGFLSAWGLIKPLLLKRLMRARA